LAAGWSDGRFQQEQCPDAPCAVFTTGFRLRLRGALEQWPRMFSHVVIFWTDPAQPQAVDKLIAGCNQYLRDIPGVLQMHVGRMVGSHRPVVDQTYQVALNLMFPSQQAQDDYQVHPRHVEFVEKVFKRTCKKVLIYDFE
jgi:hypothetical protein